MPSQQSRDPGDSPETRYARSGDVHIAYQVTGSGVTDLVVVPGFVTHVQLYWDNPISAHFAHRLGTFARVIRFDKRGTGMSDRVPIATLEERMDDLRAVMDATGTARAAIFGVSEGGPMSLLFAATYPERVASLILYGSFARRLWAPDYPIGVPTSERQAYLDFIEQRWGEEADVSIVAPGLDEEARRRFVATRRMSASPGAALAIVRMNSEIDVRHILPVIGVPTLVLHRAGDRDVTVENGRYLAANIPGARYLEFPGGDHRPTTVGDADALLDEIEEFLTGVRHGPQPDRVLATLLFTDIVESTERASSLGDQRWRELKASHHAIVRQELHRFRGIEVDTAGDGFFARFDGPARAIRCARTIAQRVRALGIEIRAGLHTGEVEVGHDGLAGLAVHIGARVMSLAGSGDVLVSSTVKDLVAGAGLEFEERGTHTLKGVPGEWRLFAVTHS